ncbi:hypothetical protein WMY93_017326 [Mugilogobius chulae]|uniref:Uncharacterized protein n=1 Tax=Mugilogobius chulae TaxID=88201 RepID=A0AAW0NUB7_9GOBI
MSHLDKCKRAGGWIRLCGCGPASDWSSSDEVQCKSVRSQAGGSEDMGGTECVCVCLREPGDSRLKFCFLQVRRLILPHNSLLQSAPLAPPLHSTTPFLCVLRLDLALSLLLIVHSQSGSSASVPAPHASRSLCPAVAPRAVGHDEQVPEGSTSMELLQGTELSLRLISLMIRSQPTLSTYLSLFLSNTCSACITSTNLTHPFSSCTEHSAADLTAPPSIRLEPEPHQGDMQNFSGTFILEEQIKVGQAQKCELKVEQKSN